jgi:hypothetical protein
MADDEFKKHKIAGRKVAQRSYFPLVRLSPHTPHGFLRIPPTTPHLFEVATAEDLRVKQN